MAVDAGGVGEGRPDGSRCLAHCRLDRRSSACAVGAWTVGASPAAGLISGETAPVAVVQSDIGSHEMLPVLRRAWRWQRVHGLVARITIDGDWLVAVCASPNRTPPPTIRSELPPPLDISGPTSRHLPAMFDWLHGLWLDSCAGPSRSAGSLSLGPMGSSVHEVDRVEPVELPCAGYR